MSFGKWVVKVLSKCQGSEGELVEGHGNLNK